MLSTVHLVSPLDPSYLIIQSLRKREAAEVVALEHAGMLQSADSSSTFITELRGCSHTRTNLKCPLASLEFL